MFGKRTMLVALMATALVLGAMAVASATDPSGLTNVLIGRGQASRSFEVNQHRGNDVVVSQITVQPAGFSGWHSHPGTTVIAVQSGQLMLFSEPIAGGKCGVHTYTAGQVFLEHPNKKYNTVNTGSEPYVLAVTFLQCAARCQLPDRPSRPRQLLKDRAHGQAARASGNPVGGELRGGRCGRCALGRPSSARPTISPSLFER